MILIGQYDSPFVRRVGIALVTYGISFEHRPWSTFDDADKIRPYSPLSRVPALVLDDGEVLIESHCILDHLDSLVPDTLAMFPKEGSDRRRALKIAALATGVADKAVSLFYELRFHESTSASWISRCRTQISSTLADLDSHRASQHTDWWFGPRFGHADIAVATAFRFIAEAHAGNVSLSNFTALSAHSDRAEALPAFKAISQRFIPPT